MCVCMGGSRNGGGKRPSGNVLIREDFLEEESIVQGLDGKGMRIESKEEGGSGAFARKKKKGPFKGRVRT